MPPPDAAKFGKSFNFLEVWLLSMFDNNLSILVESLPEFYQPIYGHDKWDNRPLRTCKDRLTIIERIYDDS